MVPVPHEFLRSTIYENTGSIPDDTPAKRLKLPVGASVLIAAFLRGVLNLDTLCFGNEPFFRAMYSDSSSAIRLINDLTLSIRSSDS